MRGREPNTISFSTEALLANLLRLQNEWEMVQASRDRAAIYGYLAAVFETVMVWANEGKAGAPIGHCAFEGTGRSGSPNRSPL